MGKTPMIKGGLALNEYDGTVLGCTGKHCVPDPVFIGAVKTPSGSGCPFFQIWLIFWGIQEGMKEQPGICDILVKIVVCYVFTFNEPFTCLGERERREIHHDPLEDKIEKA
jgi:hypothetical protein